MFMAQVKFYGRATGMDIYMYEMTIRSRTQHYWIGHPDIPTTIFLSIMQC